MSLPTNHTRPQNFAPKLLSKQIKIATFALLCCGALSPAVLTAQTVNQSSSSAADNGQTVHFNIAAQTTATALAEFTRQSRLQITFAANISIAESNSPAVNGNMPAQQALQLLLKNTGFYAQPTSTGDFLIVAAAANEAPLLMEELVVQGSYIMNDRLDTATGLGLTLQETPQSVSIMTFQRIADQDLRSLTDVINNTAGVSAKAYDSSRNAFSARGFDVNNYQIDGIPVQWEGGSSAGESQTDTALYERIEVVRGATGLLTGVGQPSASINLVRKHANSKELSGYVSAGVSRWNSYNVSLDIGTGLNESGSIRGRTVLVYDQGDSFVDYAGNEKKVAYAVIDADLSDNTLLSFGASYQDNIPTASQWGGLPVFFSDDSRTDWSRSKTVGTKWSHWSTSHETYFVNLKHEFNADWNIKINANRTESNSDMRLLFLWGQPDPVTGLDLGASPRRYDNKRSQDDIGIRVNGIYNVFSQEHELVLGASYSKQDFIYNGYQTGVAATVPNFFEWDGSYQEPSWGEKSAFDDETTKQTAYYAATRLALTDELKLVIGARVTDWERTGVYYGDTLDFGDSGVVIPYAGALYTFNDDHTLYTSYTEIFQPQNALDRNGHYLDPLTGKNYELGLKSSFFDDRLHTSVAAFKTEQENLAVTDDSFVPTAQQLSASRAADGVKSDGFELEVTGELSQNWQISASYTQFKATEEGADGNANTVNTRFPRKLLRLFTTYQFNELTLGGGVSWEGENYTNLTAPSGATVRASQESFALANLMARYQINEQLSAQLNVDNLFDKTYYSQIGFYSQLAYGEPRNISLKLKLQF